MPETVRTTITLVVLAVLVALAAVWGWNAATDSLPAKVDRPVCVDTEVEAGDRLYPQQVTVSVYNASDRSGLAGRTMRDLEDAGFAEGRTGDAARTKVGEVAIWSTEPAGPAVRLVASYLGDVDIERREGLGPGVTVVVGKDFGRPGEGERYVEVAEAATVCGPAVD
ncbi:LytR family transcriptional regulator [Nocardioides sp. MAH-18]|uniref:LytR family transcriptional regulator n=1 Tax=Nocardioides agri TaxID=2682843 RepID=A0A6L6XSL5_9ACTN|nr:MULTISPECIES: LytR C-terminal domain-containing protein [unclassified Nocardioides]MBA2955348.1 LytR C-terminal domain-containing protein [Nocardioides sp. CGMCC 1.13656]MVQ50199.1 LytR family transcriptional regulator [Nocardioides sp. MAH-18]